MKPAFSKQLIERRSNGDHPTDVFVSIGWPSNWLRGYVGASPFARGASIIAAIEPGVYDWDMLRGTSACVWFECDEHEAQAKSIALQIAAQTPLRCFTLNAVTGEMTWHRVASDWRAAA
jgi:hypothetical protein